MKCRNCKRVIQDNSIYCNWCGFKQIREKEEITVPKPRRRKNDYVGQVMVDGVRVTVKGKTEEEYYKNAKAAKVELKTAGAKKAVPTLQKCIDNYINANSNVLSPSTLYGYKQYSKHRFPDYKDKPIDTIDYQEMINTEASDKSEKTVRNAWGLVSASLKYAKMEVPEINLPTAPIPETQFLDQDQIKAFIKAIKGKPIELPALLALHSLRASELLYLDAANITKDSIHVRGATVRAADGSKTEKLQNKNATSTRDIPILIPRLAKILPKEGRAVTMPERSIHRELKRICEANKLPVCSLHDLRRSFASLAAYLGWHEETICSVGGWVPGSPVVHKIYIKISDKTVKEDAAKMRKFFTEKTAKKA